MRRYLSEGPGLTPSQRAAVAEERKATRTMWALFVLCGLAGAAAVIAIIGAIDFVLKQG